MLNSSDKGNENQNSSRFCPICMEAFQQKTGSPLPTAHTTSLKQKQNRFSLPRIYSCTTFMAMSVCLSPPIMPYRKKKFHLSAPFEHAKITQPWKKFSVFFFVMMPSSKDGLKKFVFINGKRMVIHRININCVETYTTLRTQWGKNTVI